MWEYWEQWDVVGCEVLAKSFIQPYCRAAEWKSGQCCWLKICLELKTGCSWAFLPGLDPHTLATTAQPWPITNSSTSLVMLSQTELRNQRGFTAIQGLQDWVETPILPQRASAAASGQFCYQFASWKRFYIPKSCVISLQHCCRNLCGITASLTFLSIPIQIYSSPWGADNLCFGCTTSRWDGIQ